MKRSICDILTEHDSVLKRRELISTLFNSVAKCTVVVGGSYMLKYWSEIYSNREVHDYDFIVYADGSDYDKILVFMKTLAAMSGSSLGYGDYLSIYLHNLNGKKVNVVLKKGIMPSCCIYEGLQEILKVKQEWVDKAIKEGRTPRKKDLDDIARYNIHQLTYGLPF